MHLDVYYSDLDTYKSHMLRGITLFCCKRTKFRWKKAGNMSVNSRQNKYLPYHNNKTFLYRAPIYTVVHLEVQE